MSYKRRKLPHAKLRPINLPFEWGVLAIGWYTPRPRRSKEKS